MSDIAATVISVIAETFSIGPDAVGRDTVAADIDGWDSLSHTVLMLRLEKRLGRRIDERVAIKANSVGALIDLLSSDAVAKERT